MGTIAEKLTYLEGTKSAIKDAIIAKGVEVADTDTFRSYAEKIESIEAGGSCESQSKELNITDNGTRVVTPDEGYLLNQVTVTTNVITGKPELPNGISFAASTWTTFDTDPYDWSQVYSGTNLFNQCTNLQTLTGTAISSVYFLDLYQTFNNAYKLTSIPKLQGKPSIIDYAFDNCSLLEEVDLSDMDFSELVSMYGAFANCKSWVQNIDMSNAPIKIMTTAFAGSKITQFPKINTELLELCNYAFNGCTGLTSININLPRAIDMSYMFYNCQNLTEVNISGTKYVESIQSLFTDCLYLQTIGMLDFSSVTSLGNFLQNSNKLVNLGGFLNLGSNFKSNQTLTITSSSLSRESCLNVFNTIYDFIGNGSSIRCTIVLNSNVKALLSAEDIAIATNKGWTIQ